jgi:hypothetical protein
MTGQTAPLMPLEPYPGRARTARLAAQAGGEQAGEAAARTELETSAAAIAASPVGVSPQRGRLARRAGLAAAPASRPVP